MAVRNLLVIILIALLVAGAVVWVKREMPREPDASPRGAAQSVSTADEVRSPESAEASSGLITYHPMADALGDASTPPDREPQILLEILQAYRRLSGAFPTAEDNAGVMRQLRGANPKRLRVFPEQHGRYQNNGALLDAWGTPFFFHHLSRDALEIRSAGPDRELYTPDDIVAASSPAGLGH